MALSRMSWVFRISQMVEESIPGRDEPDGPAGHGGAEHIHLLRLATGRVKSLRALQFYGGLKQLDKECLLLPLFHRLGVALVGAAQGTLKRKPLALEQAAYAHGGQVDAKLLPYQLGHQGACPQQASQAIFRSS